MKKICIIIPKGLPVPNVLGGAIETLMTYIIESNEKYHKLDITCVSIYNDNAYELSKKYKFTKFIYVKKDLKYIIKAFKVNILNFFGKGLNTYNEIILDKIKNMKFDKIVVEDGAYNCFLSYLKFFNKDQMILHFHHVGVCDRITDNTFNTFIGVSNYVTDRFSNNSSIKNLFVVRNGIDFSKFDFKPDDKIRDKIREKMGFLKNDYVLVYCGRIVPIKGVLELIDAFNLIEDRTFKLLLIGSVNFGINIESEYFRIVSNKVKESNGRIVLTGYVDNNKIAKYLQSCDLAILPFIGEEASPVSIVEIMRCKIPLISTNSGGVREIVTHENIILERNQYLVNNIKNSIIEVKNDKAYQKRLVDLQFEKSNDYSINNMYKSFVEALGGCNE